MNKPAGIREKRIALMLIAAFTWLFTFSLILFHQEHVLGHHPTVKCELFISPKSSEKNYNAKTVKPVVKIWDNFSHLLSADLSDSVTCNYFTEGSTSLDFSPFSTKEGGRSSGPLRAPPQA